MIKQPGLKQLWESEQVTPGQALQQAIMFLDELGHNPASLDLEEAGALRHICACAWNSLPIPENRPVPLPTSAITASGL